MHSVFICSLLFIEGQEPETIGFDGEVQITPFNMREELEDDGHFDASGTFIFKKASAILHMFVIYISSSIFVMILLTYSFSLID